MRTPEYLVCRKIDLTTSCHSDNLVTRMTKIGREGRRNEVTDGDEGEKLGPVANDGVAFQLSSSVANTEIP